MVAVYIILFIVFLSILIVIHELGHLTAAKIFKVYCHDFSIGFGPAFVHKKRKNGETYFSLRVIPFGGFVLMYGEGAEELDEFKGVDPSRSLAAIKKWKQAIIMAAGVFMNVVLAIVLLFISEQACPQTYVATNWARVESGSIAETSGVSDKRALFALTAMNNAGNYTNYSYLDNVAHFDGDETKNYWVCLQLNDLTYKNISYDNLIVVYGDTTRKDDDGKEIIDEKTGEPIHIPDYVAVDLTKYNSLTLSIKNGDYAFDPDTNTLHFINDDPVNHPVDPHSVTLKVKDGKLEHLGLSIYVEQYWNNYQKTTNVNGIEDDRNAIRKTFVDFANGGALIFKGLASLVTPDGWKNVGGLIAIGVTTSQALSEFGAAKFFYMWGVISINLAIVNIFPFPGLDGWHLLVIGIEGATRKKIPQKFKTIMSLIGLGILFVLMILIIVKDVIMFI